jgi:hypothetical protein
MSKTENRANKSKPFGSKVLARGARSKRETDPAGNDRRSVRIHQC